MKKISVLLILILALSISLTSCGLDVPRPEIKNGEFDFSVTYEYGGEQSTVSGVYVCEYAGLSWHLDGGYNRDWNGCVKNGEVEEMLEIAKLDDGSELYLVLHLYPEYFMGESIDGLWDKPEPYLTIRACNEDGEVSFIDDADEVEELCGAKIIGYEYDEPIENSFSIFN